MNHPPTVSLFPAAHGWHLLDARGGSPRSVPSSPSAPAATLAEAAQQLPPPVPDEILRVALPTRLSVFERFTLPSHDPEELEGMVRHQLEKTLPYPIEETTFRYQIVSRRDADPEAERGAETTLIAGAVHQPAVEALFAPLLQAGRHPAEATFRAAQIAAQAPASLAACGIWQEESDTVFGIFEQGVLVFAEIVSSPEELLESFSKILLSAELAGASTRFDALMVDPALDAFREPLARLSGVPERAVVELCTEPRADASTPLGSSGDGGMATTGAMAALPDLTPETWRQERARRARAQQIKRHCVHAVLGYAACVLLAFAYLVFRGQQLKRVERALEATRPQVDTLVTAQTRWRELAPAVDPKRFTVELLFQVAENLPSSDTRVTLFNQGKSDFVVQGESPNAAEAIALLEKLKKAEGLGEYHLEAGQPVLLPNDHAQFSISGKL